MCVYALQVSPHEFMQAVMSSSNKRFTIEQQGDVLDFWAWFINTLHQHLATGKRTKTSIISKCFQVAALHLCCHTKCLQLYGSDANQYSINKCVQGY